VFCGTFDIAYLPGHFRGKGVTSNVNAADSTIQVKSMSYWEKLKVFTTLKLKGLCVNSRKEGRF